MTTTTDRCELCGAKQETHQQDHLCRMHRDEDSVCTVCGSFGKPCHYGRLYRPCIGHRQKDGCSIDCPNNEFF